MLNNQKGSPREAGAIQLIVILILLAGILGGVFLITRGEPLKLFPQAKDARVSVPIPKPTIKPRPPSVPIPPSNTPKPTKKPRPPR